MTPRVCISALRGGSGKTVLSVGMAAAWRKAGLSIAPFKKGPDYIDAGWLALAAGRPCRNLDTFLVPPRQTLQTFFSHAGPDRIALIEGSRGLYDGMDAEGTTSTARLAQLLTCPVVLVADCGKTSRTMAAMVVGCSHFNPEVDIRGVILNHVAGSRHEAVLQKSIEKHAGLPVLGCVPRLGGNHFPERHMGLTPMPEHSLSQEAVEKAADIAEKYLNLESILNIARSPIIPSVACEPESARAARPESKGGRPRIGVARDAVFQFYYPENIEALAEAGAEVVELSLLEKGAFPNIDALYLGGGFPETHAQALADNQGTRNRVRDLARQGLPIYAECGGLMYLARALVLDGNSYPMAGVLPITVGLCSRPQGHGYTVAEVEGDNPYFATGSRIKGHEFHYSKILSWEGKKEDLAFSMARGKGIWEGRDGVTVANVLATYTHIHALGTPEWAPALAGMALRFKTSK